MVESIGSFAHPTVLKYLSKLKTPVQQLGVGVIIENLHRNGLFPEKHSDVLPEIIHFVSKQLDINEKFWIKYGLNNSSYRRHKEDVKVLTGFKSPRSVDYESIKSLFIKKLDVSMSESEVSQLIIQEFIKRKLIILETKRFDGLILSIIHKIEINFFRKVSNQLRSADKTKFDMLLDGKLEIEISTLKQHPGKIGIESLRKEADKLAFLKNIHVPNSLMIAIPKAYLIKQKRRLASESLHEIKRHPDYVKYALLTIFTYIRVREITDDMVDLLILLVHKMGARAERKVTNELVNGFKKVRNKDSIITNILDASLEQPDGKISEVIYPLAGGEEAIRNILKEFKANGSMYRQKVQMTIRSSYVHHYRKMIPILFSNLEFKSNNLIHQPVIKGIKLIQKYQDSTKPTYPDSGKVPIEGVVKSDWKPFIYQNDLISQANYEMALLTTLRKKLRCKEVWVDNAFKYGDPDKDLPQDFQKNKTDYFKKLNLEQSSTVFIDSLKKEMKEALDRLNKNIPTNPKVNIINKKGRGWIVVSPSEAQPESQHLLELKKHVTEKWPMTSLLVNAP